MSDLHARKFLLVLAAPSAPPPFPVGANVDEGPVSPVIVGGRTTLVENGNYNLTLEQMGPRWLSRGIKDNVVVGLMPLPGEWTITRQADGTFSIEEPGDSFPTTSWALDSSEPGTRVKLRRMDFPARWNFIPVEE